MTLLKLFMFLTKCMHFKKSLRKKVELKWLDPGAVLENDGTLEGGAVFSLIIMFSGFLITVSNVSVPYTSRNGTKYYITSCYINNRRHRSFI